MKKKVIECKVKAIIVAWYDSGTVAELFLKDIMEIFSRMPLQGFLITNSGFNIINNAKIEKIGIRERNNYQYRFKLLKFIYVNFLCVYFIIKNLSEIDIIICPLGGISGEYNFVLVLISKIFRKKVIVFHRGGKKPDDFLLIMPDSLLKSISYIFLKVIMRIEYKLSDIIVIQSNNIIKYGALEKFRGKIFITSARFVNTDNFISKINISNRPRNVGFVGRLSKEKGILNFLNGIMIILETRKDIRFLIVGSGPLFSDIKQFIDERKLYNCIEMVDWIYDTNDLINLLNNLTLLVLPSYTEGLPGIMVEAMACGTPVLATPVGAIPDVIRDGETGFIMEENSPECIARNVMRALSDPDLEGVAERGRRFVEREFTFEKAVERWRGILGEIQ